MAVELPVELGDVNCAAVIQNSVQALEDALLGEVHLVDEEPVPLFDRPEEGTVAPPERDVLGVALLLAPLLVDLGVLAAEQIHHVGLLAEVDSRQRPSADLGQVLNQAGLSDARRALDEDWLVQLVGAKETVQVRPGGRRIEGERRVLRGRPPVE